MIRNIIILSVLGAALYVVLLPVPSDIEIPWRLKLFTISFKVITIISPYVPSGFVKFWLENGSREHNRLLGSDVPYTDTVFDGVSVRVFADDQQEESSKRPAIVFYHGGGWSLGNVDMYHPLTGEFARNISAVVVSVEYRLAPKFIFPAAIDDCTTATVSFLHHLQDFNVDPTRVAVMGDSAGGNLAAAVAQRLTFDPKYQNLPKIKLQVLIYPCLQAFDFQTPSYQQNGDYMTIILDRVTMIAFWAQYMDSKLSKKTAMALNKHTSASDKASPLVKKCLSHDLIPAEFKQTGYEAPSTDFGDVDLYEEIKDVLLNPDLAPLMREDLRGLPEAYILTAQYDILRDDGIMYAKRLEEAGVKVTLNNYKNGFHGMFGGTNGRFKCPSSQVAVDDFYKFIKKRL